MKSKKLRQSAKGQECTFRIIGVCNYDTETTVLAHLPHNSKGMGHKATDFSSAFACSACHDAIDDRVRSEEYQANKPFYNTRALVDTMQIWFDSGVIKIA